MPYDGLSIIPKVLSGLEPFNHARSKYKFTSHLEADGSLFGEVSKGRYQYLQLAKGQLMMALKRCKNQVIIQKNVDLSVISHLILGLRASLPHPRLSMVLIPRYRSPGTVTDLTLLSYRVSFTTFPNRHPGDSLFIEQIRKDG